MRCCRRGEARRLRVSNPNAPPIYPSLQSVGALTDCVISLAKDKWYRVLSRQGVSGNTELGDPGQACSLCTLPKRPLPHNSQRLVVSDVLSIPSRGKEQKTMEQKPATIATFYLAACATKRLLKRLPSPPFSFPHRKTLCEKLFCNWERCVSLVNMVCFLWSDSVNEVVSYIAQVAGELRRIPQLNHSNSCEEFHSSILGLFYGFV